MRKQFRRRHAQFCRQPCQNGQTETFPAGYLALRDQLVAEQKLIEGQTPELYTFVTNVAFTSPSAAASIVAARSASGPREWKLKSTSQMYKDWKAAGLERD